MGGCAPIRHIVVPHEQLLELNRKAMQETVGASVASAAERPARK